MPTAARIERQRAMLLVIDLQTKLLPHIEEDDLVVAATTALLDGAEIFEIPVVATVQYVKGLGHTHSTPAAALQRIGVEPLEKMAFSVCGDDAAKQRIAEQNRDQVIVAGIEAHVCVMQTVLDLLEMGLKPYVCTDAVSSRYGLDVDVAMLRMQEAGAAITTTEAVLFELCGLSGTPEFKKLLNVVKTFDEARK